MTSIVFVVSAASQWTLADGSHQPTGFWAEEALGPYRVFSDAGYQIAVVTPRIVLWLICAQTTVKGQHSNLTSKWIGCSTQVKIPIPPCHWLSV